MKLLEMKFFIILAALLFAIIFSGAASAATYNITPSQSIQTTINNAQTGDIINLANGTYYQHDITINKALTITGQGQSNTIIDAQGMGRIFNIPSGVSVTLQNLALTGGYVTDDNGGAIYNSGTLNIRNCLFTNNTIAGTANGGGGAVFNYVGTLNIIGSTFNNNAAGMGGAILNLGYGTGTLVVTDSNFNGNTAITKGGAIYNEGPNKNTVTNCYFTSNTAEYGGAICHYGNDLEVTGTWTFISYNYPYYAFPNFAYNSATYGGAIYQQGNSKIIYYNFIGNTAQQGNAIYNYGGSIEAYNNYWGSPADPKTVPNTIAGAVSSVDAYSYYTVFYGPPGATQNPPGSTNPNTNNGNNQQTPSLNATNTNTIGMQETGFPITGLIIAALMVLGGLYSSRKR